MPYLERAAFQRSLEVLGLTTNHSSVSPERVGAADDLSVGVLGRLVEPETVVSTTVTCESA